jgi:hypothetical protein
MYSLKNINIYKLYWVNTNLMPFIIIFYFIKFLITNLNFLRGKYNVSRRKSNFKIKNVKS